MTQSGGSTHWGGLIGKKIGNACKEPQKPSVPTDLVISLLSTDPKKMSRDANKGLTMKMLTVILLREQKIRNNLDVPK